MRRSGSHSAAPISRARQPRPANRIHRILPRPTQPTVTPPICVLFTFAKSEEKRNAWLFGWTVGVGLDYLVLPNVFLRGEYEYVSFAGVSGTKASINTAWLGAGYRF